MAKSQKLAVSALLTCIFVIVWLGLKLVPFGWSGSIIRWGPDVQSDLVLVFNTDASKIEIYSYTQTVIGVPDPRGGSDLLPGVQSLNAVRVGSHDGYAIQFCTIRHPGAEKLCSGSRELVSARMARL